MKKVEEFKRTEELINEFKGLVDKGPEIDSQIELLNKRTNLTIERLEDEMKLSWEDIELNIDRKSVEKEYKDRIDEVNKNHEVEVEDLNKQKEEAENEKKEFFTDEKAKTITMEIKDMEKEIKSGKLEIKKKEIELQQKDVELQEFYTEQEHENPLRWQEIYNEIDKIKAEIKELKENIGTFEKKIDEYSKFKQEIFEMKFPTISVSVDEVQIEPTAEPKTEPKTEPKVEPKVEPVTEPQPVDLSNLDIKITIGKNGINIHTPEGNKEISLKEFKIDLEPRMTDDFIAKYLAWAGFSKEEADEVDIDLMALQGIYHMGSTKVISKEVEKELVKRYVSAMQKGETKDGKSLKGILEYDRTDLDYLKPRNIISRIINKSRFDDIRYFADLAEKSGVADIKQDEPGKIRQFLFNMKNKVKLLGTGNKDRIENTEAYKQADEEGKALLKAAEEHRRKTQNQVATHTSITEKDGKVVATTGVLMKDGKLKENKFKNSLYNKDAAEVSSRNHEDFVGDFEDEPSKDDEEQTV